MMFCAGALWLHRAATVSRLHPARQTARAFAMRFAAPPRSTKIAGALAALQRDHTGERHAQVVPRDARVFTQPLVARAHSEHF